MPRDEHPDRAWERRQADADERCCRERRADRLADYTPAISYGTGGSEEQGPRLTSAMTVLARTVLEGPDYDRRDAARVLAELVLEASE